MQPELEIDTRQWRQAAIALLRTSSRSVVDFTNGQALKVTIEAVRQTERANAAKIQAELGATGRGVSFKARTRDTKAGKNGSFRVIKGKLEVRENSLAERILLKRFEILKKWGVKGETMAERVRNLINSRIRSAAFITSGWIPARRKLFAVVKQKPPGASPSFSGARQYGKDKGSATPATNSGGLRAVIVTEIKNTALLSQSRVPSKARDPLPVARKGLGAALRIAATDMMATLAKRLGRDLKPFNAKR